MVLDWIVILVVLALSAFFSAMEIAYVASSRLRIELDRSEHPLYAKISKLFLSHPGQYLSTILIGNNIALVIYSMLMGEILALYISSNIAVETLISSVVVIFFAEFLPKAVVKREPHLYLRVFAVPLLFFYLLFIRLRNFALRYLCFSHGFSLVVSEINTRARGTSRWRTCRILLRTVFSREKGITRLECLIWKCSRKRLTFQI